MYGGLGVHLGNSEGWKPQKEGGCGGLGALGIAFLDHVAKDMACSWFVAVASQSAQNLGLLGAFLGVSGHMVELEGRKGLVDTGKSSRTCSVPTVSLCLAVLNGF